MRTTALIEIRDLSITLGEFALHDVNLEVGEGEYFVVLGPTGAGKTVLLECIAGLHVPPEGEICIRKENVTRVPPEVRGIGYVPQEYALFPHMTVFDNMAYGLRLRKVDRRKIRRTVQELAEMLGITHLLKRYPGTMSGGEQQRAALGRALAIKPQIMLLDEPLSAVDESTRETLCGELKRLQQELHTTTIHVCHNFQEALAVADTLCILHQGRVRQVGPARDIFRKPGSKFVAHFLGVGNLFEAKPVPASRPCVSVDGVKIWTDSLLDNPGWVSVRAEDVVVALPGTNVEAENVVSGKVVGLMDRGNYTRITVDGALRIVAYATRAHVERLRLTMGCDVVVAFTAEAAHAFVDES